MDSSPARTTHVASQVFVLGGGQVLYPEYSGSPTYLIDSAEMSEITMTSKADTHHLCFDWPQHSQICWVFHSHITMSHFSLNFHKLSCRVPKKESFAFSYLNLVVKL